jgi:thiol:disulfide interchange protein
MDRTRRLKLLFGIGLLIAAVVLYVRAANAKDRVAWRTDVASAKAANKPLMLYFTADWCGPCQTLKRTTWANADVAAALDDVIPLKVDVDQNQSLAMEYGAYAIPSVVMETSTGGYLGQPTIEELNQPQPFVAWLTRAHSATPTTRPSPIVPPFMLQ